MHGMIDKTDVSASELRERFGARTTDLVLAVSDDEQIAVYAKRKAAVRRRVSGAGDEALTLFAADKFSRLGELRRETAADPGPASATARPVRELPARRLRHDRRSLALLRNVSPNRRSSGNCATSSPSSHASARWPGGPAEQQRPVRPEASLTAPDRGELGRNHPEAGSLFSRSHAGHWRHDRPCCGESRRQLLRIRSALVFRGCRRQLDARLDVVVARRRSRTR
jgi:hypothetical protein